MGRYTIKDLEQLSGIKAHTIRIWEQRYSLIVPHRTDTNIRFYDDQQLKRLLNISLLVNEGHKISRVSQLENKEVKDLIKDLFEEQNQANQPMSIQINSLIVSMMDLDEVNFSKVFSHCLLRFGFFQTVTEIIYPFLNKVGLMWGIDQVNPAQEHFATNVIRQKLFTAIDSLPVPPSDAKKFILFLPEGEMHEIGLLLANYMLRTNKQKVIYLGQNVPLQDLEKIYQITQPDFLVTFLIRENVQGEIDSMLGQIAGMFSKTKIFIAGNSLLLAKSTLPSNFKWLKSIDELLNVI